MSDGRAPERIVICDVGPRDGLQNESRSLPAALRAELCNRLARAGLPRVEAVSFVNPKLVPQMADAEAVVEGLQRGAGTVYAGLVVNERGYERAVASGVDEVHYAFPATDSFCERNQGMTLAGAVEVATRLLDRSHQDRIRMTVTIGASFGCPFEGRVNPSRVFDLARRLHEHDPAEIVLADTIGVGVPSQVRELVSGVAALGATVGCHLHNTRNTGYANALSAVEAGARLLDASIGGTGGCPFAPRATGNIATEDLVYMLHGMGYPTGINLAAVVGTASWLAEALDKELPGQTYKAGTFAPVAA
jgi:isopropylmalate/homocitrate/citramalate synthase